MNIFNYLEYNSLIILSFFFISLISLILNILTIAVLKLGVEGLFLSYILGNLITSIYVFFKINLKDYQIKNVISMLSDGATIPFMARYRKEVTGNLNEDELKRLMTSMVTKEESSYSNNLINLGYQDLDEPTMISFYFNSFDSKENFIKYFSL